MVEVEVEVEEREVLEEVAVVEAAVVLVLESLASCQLFTRTVGRSADNF